MLIGIIAALVALDLTVSARAIVGLARRRAMWRRRARPFGCFACRVDYSDPRALAWHLQGQHRDLYDYANDHAVASRHGAQGEPATGPVEPHETAGDGTYQPAVAA